MPALTVAQPTNNQVVALGQPFAVSGQVSDVGMPEPRSIDSVTVRVDAGSPIDAVLSAVPNRNKKVTLVAFNASVQVSGGADPHVVTITATNDLGRSATATVHVFTGTPFQVAAPALQLELSPAPIDPGNPNNKAAVDLLVSQIQAQLAPMASRLASSGQVLAGPNLVLATNPSGGQVLRIGLWIVDPSFPVVAAQPPDFPLPRLSDQAAVAGFNTVPLLPLPAASGLQLFAYGIFIPTTTLQQIVDAMFADLKKVAAKQSVTLDSVTVACSSPGSVTTSFAGHLGFPPANVSGTITETLGTTPVPGVQPPQSVPAITGSSHSSGSNVLDQVLLGLIAPLFLIEALVITIETPIGVGGIAGQAAGIAASFVASIPSTIPFRNTLTSFLPAFPMVVPNWTSFGTTNAGMRGLGTITIPPRDQTMVAMTLSGQTNIVGIQADLAGGTDAIYSLTWANLVPDPDKFTWQVSGAAGSDGGPIGLAPLSQKGGFDATFPLPLNVQPGRLTFSLAVNATETAGLDPTKTLTASSSTGVAILVKKNPKVIP